jgi:hypothetical protein
MGALTGDAAEDKTQGLSGTGQIKGNVSHTMRVAAEKKKLSKR